MAFFDPDGRSSVQFIGHKLIQLVHIYLFVLGLIIITPLAIYVWYSMTLRAQSGDIRLWSQMPSTTVVLDLGHPTLAVTDLEANAEFAAPKTQVGVDPATRSFPAGLQGASGTFFWYNLPFTPGAVTDLDRDHSAMANLTQHWSDTPRHGDPWWVVGCWNTAPARNWDTGSGELMLQAKATQNYYAYTLATDIVARLRVWAVGRKMGRDLAAKLASEDGGGWTNPAEVGVMLVAGDIPARVLPARAAELAPGYAQFVQVYNSTFTQGLPVVTIQLQSLDATEFERQGRHVAEWTRDFVGLRCRSAHGPFMTGLALPGAEGRPEFSALDLLWWSTPSSSKGAAEAQAKLLALTEVSYWKPLLQAEGLSDVTSLTQAKAILDYVVKAHTDFAKIARRDAHHFFSFSGNNLSPFEDINKWSPHGW